MQKKFEDIITESKSYKSKKVEEAYDPSIPDWLKKDKRNLSTSGTNMRDFKSEIDLSNAQFVPLDELSNTDPIWRDTDYIKIFNTPNGIYATDGEKDYISEWDDTYYDSDDHYRTKHLSKLSRKNLINMATDIGYIKKSDTPESDTNARKYGRYEDPRKGRRTTWGYNADEYAGQVKNNKGEWETGQDRDKSGYEIPDPSELLAKYYKVDGIDDVKVVMDRYYKKVKSIVDDVMSLDFRKFQGDFISNDSYIYSNLHDLVNYYNRFVYEGKDAIDWFVNGDIPDYYNSFSEFFNSKTKSSRDGLSQEIMRLREKLRKLKKKMNESELTESYLAADEKVYSFQLDVVVPSNIDAEFEFPAKLQRVLNNRGYEVLSATMLDDITDWYAEYFEGE